MLSKNNLQLLTERNAQQHQRFGIRKLTIGVASVLLGTTFLMGGVVHADTNGFSTAETISGTTAVTNTSSTQDGQLSKNNSTTGKDQQAAGQNATTTLNTSDGQSVASAQAVSENKTADVATPTFSGKTNWEPNTTQGKWTGTASDVQYKAGDQSQITYVIQSWGGTNVANSADFQGSTQYLIMLPAGFDTDKLTPSRTDAALGYNLQDLGYVGPNGERTFMLTLAQTPSYGNPLNISATITPTATAGGAYNYYNQWTPLLMPLSDHLKATSESGAGGGTGTITLKNGTTYTYVRDLTSFNNAQWWDNDSKPAYTIIPGAKQLANTGYKIVSVKASKTNANQADQVGYEEIDPTIQIIGDVQDGDYIDFHLGIPYQDSQTGTVKYLAYDQNLAKTFKVANVGTVYNMGDYYRLVFDSSATILNHPIFDLQLRWGSDDQEASLNKWNANYVYQTTEDPKKDHTSFTYTPTNDVTINGQTLSSGFTVNGQYIYTAKPIGVGNTQIGAGAIYSTNRTWNKQGDVAVNTQWFDNQAAKLSTKDLGDEFDIRTTFTNDPTGQVKYSITSAADMEKAIENDVATNDQQSLTNEVVSDHQTYVKFDTEKGDKPKIKATVTLTVTSDPQNPNQQTAVWHVKVTNLDPTKNPKIVLNGSVPTVSAFASNFTMPSDITSYDEDVAAQKTGATYNYNGTKTSNEALMKVLQSLPVPLTQFVAYQNGQQKTYSGIYGNPWKAEISYAGDKTVDGGGSAADLVINTLSFKDIDSGQTVANNVTYQGSTGSKITFADGQEAYDGLKGYHFVKAVSVQNGTETELTNFDPTKIAIYNFGTANKKQPNQFIIYVQKDQTKQTASVTMTINYWYDHKGGKIAHETYTHTVTYTKIGDGDWQADDSFTTVVSPKIAGYTPDKTQIEAPSVDDLKNNDQINKVYDVIYTANDQTAKITYVDDTTGTTLSTDTANGKFGTTIVFDQDPAQQIKNYEQQHYVLVNNDFAANKQYQADNGQNNFTVHLKHATKDVTKTATTTRTINYVVDDGSQTITPVVQSVTFTGTASQDEVTNTTGDYQWQVISGNPDFAAVTTPKVAGYHVAKVDSDTADQIDGTDVKAMTIKPNTKNIVITIHYAQDQAASLNFVDDETGDTIHPTMAVSGVQGQKINFGDVQAVVDQLTKQHYVLKNVTDDTPTEATMLMVLAALSGRQIGDATTSDWANVFGNFTGNNQSFTIHFTHAHGALANSQQKTVTETVKYQDGQGKQVAESTTAQLTFHEVGYRDLVTGQDVVTGWQNANGGADEGSFNSISLPTVQGYHVVSATDDQANNVLDTANQQVKAQTGITHESPNVNITVVYAADSTPSTPEQPQQPDKPTPKPTSGQPDKPAPQPSPVPQPTPEQPTTRVKINPARPSETKTVITAKNSTTASLTSSAKQSGQRQLPQTGRDSQTVLLGLGIASLTAMLGLAHGRRKQTK